MDSTEAAITVEGAMGRLGAYDGQTVGVLALTEAGIDAAGRSMAKVSELVAWEIDTGDAPSYARQTFTAAYDVVGSVGARMGQLGFGSGQSAAFDLAGAPSVGGFAFYDPASGTGDDLDLIAVNRVAASAGYDGYPVLAPNGFARVQAEPRDLTTRANTLQPRTVPDAADGSPGQAWMTDGAVGAWSDLPESVGKVVFFVADMDASGGTPTTVQPVTSTGEPQDAPVARSVFVGRRLAVYDGPDGGKVWEVTAHPNPMILVEPQPKLVLANNPAGGLYMAEAVNDELFGLDDATLPPTHFRAANYSIGELTALLNSVYNTYHEAAADLADALAASQDAKFSLRDAVLGAPMNRFTLYVGDAFDGGGTDDLVDTSRTDDDEGWWLPNPGAVMVSGNPLPTEDGVIAMVIARNTAGGVNGFFAHVQIGATLNGNLITNAPFADPKPVTGDWVLMRSQLIDGWFHTDDIWPGMPIVVDSISQEWKTIDPGAATDFAVIGTNEDRVLVKGARFTGNLAALDDSSTVADALDEIDAMAGGGGGAVDSVNGQTGTVVLDATDVGAATSSDITSAISTHAGASDPHGDRAYVDSQLAAAVAGFDWKASVRACSTSNIASLSGTTTVDGVALSAGDRVLLAGQSTGSQNGIYVVAAGAWSRAADADASAEVTAGMSVPVAEGTSNGDAVWVLTTNDPITLGSTSLAFTKIPMVQGLIPASNLSDLANAATARTNLGLGTAATKNTGTTSSDVATGDAPQATRIKVVSSSRSYSGQVHMTPLVPGTGAGTVVIPAGTMIGAYAAHSGQTIATIGINVQSSSLSAGQAATIVIYNEASDGGPGTVAWSEDITVGTSTGYLSASISRALNYGGAWVFVLNKSTNAGSVTIRSFSPQVNTTRQVVYMSNTTWYGIYDVTSVSSPPDLSSYQYRSGSTTAVLNTGNFTTFPVVGALT